MFPSSPQRLFAALSLSLALIGLTACAHRKNKPSTPSRPAPGVSKPATSAPLPAPVSESIVDGNRWSSSMENRLQAVTKATGGNGIEISRTPSNQLRILVPNDLVFGPYSYSIGGALKPTLDTLAASLRNDESIQVQVASHTDNTGSDPQNNTLSLERARSVRDYLVGKGAATPFIQVVGRGSREPVASNDNPADRTRNRRTEITVREAVK